MSYTINWSQPGTPPDGKQAITILELSEDTTTTSLTLTGKGKRDYGEKQQQNLIRLLENFASDTPPPQPTIGQLWFNRPANKLFIYNEFYAWVPIDGMFRRDEEPPVNIVVPGDLWWDTNDEILYLRVDTRWEQLWPSLSVVPVAWVEEFIHWADLYNLVAAMPDANEFLTNEHAPSTTFDPTFGFGQNRIEYPTINTLTNEMWVNLLDKYAKICAHENLNADGLYSAVPGEVRGFILDRTTLHGVVTALEEYQFARTQMERILPYRLQTNPLSFETNAAITNSSFTRTAAYYAEKIHTRTAKFTSMEHARAYFNSGGKLKFFSTFTPTQSTTFNTEWATFMAGLGTGGKISFGRANITNDPANYDCALSFYQLNDAAYQQIYRKAILTGTSAGAYIELRAKLVLQPGGGVDVVVAMHYAPDGMEDGVYAGGYSSSAIGTTVSSIECIKPSDAFLNNPEIEYPTFEQGGTFITDLTI